MGREQLDDEPAGAGRTPMSITRAVAGTFLALAAGPGVVVAATLIAGVASTVQYGEVYGLVAGGAIGGLLSLIALVLGIVRSRAPDGRRRGFAIGLIIGSGLSILAAGACFASI